MKKMQRETNLRRVRSFLVTMIPTEKITRVAKIPLQLEGR